MPTESSSAEIEIDTGVHVDDVSQSFYNDTESGVIAQSVAEGLSFATKVQSKGPRISANCFVIASSVALARKVQAKFAAEGIKTKAVSHGDDLGVG